jgi:hypothetical protein
VRLPTPVEVFVGLGLGSRGARTREESSASFAIVKQNGSKSGRLIGNPAFSSISAPIVSMIRELRSEGNSYRAIAAELNRRQIPTAQGGREWHGQTVKNACERDAA